jgi:N-methylhydantoinase B
MQLDPIELEIIKGRLEEAALTMENQLFHSGYSPILRESFDGSAAILDRHGGVVLSAGMPIHLFPYYYCAKGVIEIWDREMSPGDSFLINDPYLGGSLHVPDTAVITPFFHSGRLAGFCASMAHKPDMGGLVVGSSSPNAREIYHEGIQFPAVRYWSSEGPSRDIENMIKSNSRSSDEVIGDLRSQVGCTRVGCSRLTELFDRYGTDTMIEAFESLIAGSERRIRAKVAAMPDGVSEATATLDHDGVDVTKPLTIRLKMTKQGDALTLDFSSTDPRAVGPVNLRPQATESASAVGVLSLLDPTIPINDACRRAITFVNPPGTITHAVKPNPINNYYPTLHLVCSVTQTAFASLSPDRAVAPSGLGVGGMLFGYPRKRNGKPGVQYELMCPSLGGTPSQDGSFLVMPVAQITPSQPIEILETEYPIEVLRFEPLIDTAGAGKYRGGAGWIREYRILSDAVCTVRMGQFAHGSWGINGGHAPNLASCAINPGGNKEDQLPILATRNIAPGDVFRVVLAGGGGYGLPMEREPALVAQDAADGIVSVAAARADYKVALSDDFQLDEEATAALRRASVKVRYVRGQRT